MNHSNGPITDGEADEDERNSLTCKLLTDVKAEVVLVSITVETLTSLNLNLRNPLEKLSSFFAYRFFP